MAFFEGLKMTGGYGNGPDIIIHVRLMLIEER